MTDINNNSIINPSLYQLLNPNVFIGSNTEIVKHNWSRPERLNHEQRIKQLTKDFMGRIDERNLFMEWAMSQNKGFFSVMGNSGIGKSTIMAKFVDDLKASVDHRAFKVIPYFIRPYTSLCRGDVFVDYLLRCTDEFFPKGRHIQSASTACHDRYNQLLAKWEFWQNNPKGLKFVILIDGIDEGMDEDLLEYIPRFCFDNILFVYSYSSGDVPPIKKMKDSWPSEFHKHITLAGLNKDNFRDLLIKTQKRHQLVLENEWIECLWKKSLGNPLYIKLICDELITDLKTFREVESLPKNLDGIYRLIILQYANKPFGRLLLQCLYILAVSKKFHLIGELFCLNNDNEENIFEIGNTINKGLFQGPTNSFVDDCLFFHESFCDFLLRQDLESSGNFRMK
jgi:hypothetical protein